MLLADGAGVILLVDGAGVVMLGYVKCKLLGGGSARLIFSAKR